ncbi:MAG: RNA polymerase sigma factor, partial [Planctomycetota bacterium]
MKSRSNLQWLEELRDSSESAEELRSFLRRGLAKALSKKAVGDSDLDDFAQDAVLRVLQGLDGFRGDSSFTTWAMAVALRTAFGSLRRRRFDPTSLDAIEVTQADSSSEDPAAEVEAGDLLGRLQHAIEQDLTPRQRAAVLGELSG